MLAFMHLKKSGVWLGSNGTLASKRVLSDSCFYWYNALIIISICVYDQHGINSPHRSYQISLQPKAYKLPGLKGNQQLKLSHMVSFLIFSSAEIFKEIGTMSDNALAQDINR